MCAIRTVDDTAAVMDKDTENCFKRSCRCTTMLQNLHVKNLALIDEAEVEFGPGLNILTGETGAGKSYSARIGSACTGRPLQRGAAPLAEQKAD